MGSTLGLDAAKIQYSIYMSGNTVRQPFPESAARVGDQDYSYMDYTSPGSRSLPYRPLPDPSPVTLKSDTTAPYSFGSNSSYIYKITTSSSSAPTAVSSNSSAVSVALYQKVSGGYLYKITNVGAGTALITTSLGDYSVAFTAYGKASGIISDTTHPFTIKRGATYQFKFTPNGTTATPKFTTGNGSVLRPVLTQKVGASYYYKISGVGSGCTGVYSTLPGQQAVRQCIVTVA